MTTVSRETPLKLGAFDLTRFVARGGMGEVWAGLARDADSPVAIKVLSAESAADAQSHEAFRSEVRAIARLRHPSITSVYDVGRVDEEAARASDGLLAAGSPYLVMELLPGHCVTGLIGHLSWLDLRQILFEILSALAHTHARGIIHRDLKPSNVLLTSINVAVEGAPAIKLSDFGIAHALEGGADSWRKDRAKGTPGYMSGEQAQNRWRDFGPWTDLFSLGRLVARLLGTREQCVRLLKEAPGGLSGWIERLLEENPEDRFSCAADAAYALSELGNKQKSNVARAQLHLGPIDDLPSQAPTIADAAIPTVVEHPTEHLAPTTKTGANAQRSVVPPMVDDWRDLESPPSRGNLTGIGLGLYGLRPLPVIEREAERDILWTALCRVRRSGAAEAIILRGPSGFGKSRLAQWLCELAHESGAASTLRAIHAPFPGSEHGLSAMVSRHFRCEGLDRGRILTRLEPRLRAVGLEEPTDWLGLTALLIPETDNETDPALPRLRLETASERQSILHRLLVAMSGDRPVVVWLDDVQWGVESIELVKGVLAAAAEAPLLFVLTAQDEELAGHEDEARALESLATLSRATSLEIGPLAPIRHQRLVRQLLGLGDSLAIRVEELTAGNPLFAEQVVGQWVHRGFLQLADGSFSLRPGAAVELPGDLSELWVARIEQVVGENRQDVLALEVAAVLGRVVDEAEWRNVCNEAGLEPSHELVGALASARLANYVGNAPGLSSWEFVHGMLRESLERRARDGHRILHHHRACADYLRNQSGAVAGERRARHLLGAGERREAATIMGEAAHRRYLGGEYRQARLLLAERELALDELQIPETTAMRAHGWLLWAKCARTAGQLDEAVKWANRAVQTGRTLGLDAVRADALLVLESIARVRGETARAWRRAREAERIAANCDSAALLGCCFKEQGWIMLTRGSVDRASELFRRGLETLTRAGSGSQADSASCLNGLAHGAIQQERLKDARRHLTSALAIHRRLGSGSHQALTVGSLGDVERAAGRLDEAEQHYQTALRLLEAGGYGHTEYAEMNLALVFIERKQYGRARPILRGALAKLEQHDAHAPVGAVHAMLLPCAAAARDWPAFDAHLSLSLELLGDGSMADADIATPARLAGELASEAGEGARAIAAYRLSLRQWQELGRTDRAAEIREVLTALVSQAPPPLR